LVSNDKAVEGRAFDPSAIWLVPETRRVLDSMTEMFLALDRDYNLVFANQALAEQAATKHGDLVGKNHWTYWPEMRGTVVEESYTRAFVTGVPVRFEYYHPKSQVWLDISAYPSGSYLHVYFRDITGTVRLREEQRQRADAIETLLASLPHIAWVTDEAGQIVYINDRWRAFTGSESTREAIVAAIHPDDMEAVRHTMARARETGEGATYRVRLRRHDGEYRWQEVRAAPLVDTDGPRLYIGTTTDVHEAHHWATALSESEQRLKTVFDSVGVGMAEVDTTTQRLVWVNPKLCEMLGYSLDELLGRTPWELRHPEDADVGGDQIREMLAGGREAGAFESRYVAKDGRTLWFLARISRVPVPGGGQRNLATYTDVTEQKSEGEVLRRTQESLALAMKAGRMGWWARDLTTGVVTWSPELEALFGLKPGTFQGDESSFLDLVHPQDREVLVQAVRHAIESGSEYSVEFRFRHADGTERWMDGRGQAVYAEDGRPTWLYGIGIDITDRKRSEEAVRQSDERARLALSTAGMGTWEINVVTQEAKSSIEVGPLYGMPPGYAHRDTADWLAMVHPGDRERLAEARRQLFEDGVPYEQEFRVPQPDGSVRWLYSRATLFRDGDGKPWKAVGVVSDVSRRKEAEEAIREGERRNRLMVEVSDALHRAEDVQASAAAACRLTAEYLNAFRVNYALVAMAEGSVEVLDDYAADGQSMAGRYRIEDFGQEVAEAYAAGDPIAIRDSATHPLTRDRFEAHYAPLRMRSFVGIPFLKNGQYVACLGAHSDVPREWTADEVEVLSEVGHRIWDAVERIRSQRALQESEERFKLLTNVMPHMVWSADAQGQADYANERWCDYFGMEFTDAARNGYVDVIHPEDLASTMDGWAESIRTGEPLRMEYRVRRHDGVYRWHLLLALPMRDGAGQVVRWFGSLTDLEPIKALERELRESRDRLADMNADLEEKVAERTADLQAANEALLGFTYHVSHDLRAPLRAIVSTSRIVQEDFGDNLPPDANRLLERQAGAAHRLGVLIDDLLQLSRLSREQIVKRPVDLTAMTREAAAEVFSQYPDTRVKVEVADGLQTLADSRLFKLALLNLIENAVKYSPDGGTVRVGQRSGGEFFVSDEGIGMDPQYLEKIFEPFQRLHRDDQFGGTGIGLANVKQVIERHGGRVWAESEPGKGSTFWFRL
jgi:PAS domain S-box-containing protein